MNNKSDRALRAVCGAVLLLAIASCGHRGPATSTGIPGAPVAAPASSLPQLPTPADLARRPSVADSSRWLDGHYVDTALPGHKNDVAGFSKQGQSVRKSASAYVFNTLTMTPTWDPAVLATAGDASYACYNFSSMNTYAGTAQIVLDWFTAPDPANLWIGVANYQTNHWQWFASPAVGAPLPLSSLAPYVSPNGNTYICLLLLGTASAELNFVLVGEPITPVADLSSDLPSDPLQRIGPLTVNFDATGSYTVGSTIVSYSVDFDGDGTLEVIGDTTGIYQHTYSPGDYIARLSLADSLGHTGTYDLPFHVINPANQAPTALFTPISPVGAAPLAVTYDASASSDPDGTIIKYDWDFDGDGVTDFTSPAPAATHSFTSQGTNVVTLHVTDNDLATDQYAAQAVCTTGWRYSVIATNIPNVSDRISLVVAGSGAAARPQLTWFNGSAQSLFFARGSDNTGQAWDSPVTVVAGGNSVTAGFSPSLIQENVAQVPAIAFGTVDADTNEHTLKYVTATSATGQTWNAPTIVDIGPGLGEDNCLGQFNNKLAIATVYNSGSQQGTVLRLYRSANAGGTIWIAPLILATGKSQEELLGVRLLAIPAGSPIAVWGGYSNRMTYYCATSKTADASAWNAATTLADASTLSEQYLSLALAGGRPAVAIGDRANNSNLYFQRADDSQGSAWTSSALTVDAAPGQGGYCCMTTVGGVPAIAYYDVPDHSLKYVTAADAAGSAWNPAQFVDTAGDVGINLALAELPGNIPLVVYSDLTKHSVKAAVLY